MIPFFTIFAVIFIVVFTIGSRRNSAAQEKVTEEFWRREQEANNVRKQDISHLDYITIPLGDFPMNLGTASEQTLLELSDKKILNLTGLTNTDLKLQYGVANLDALSKYDANFAQLVKTLAEYSSELLDLGRYMEAQTVLEYAVSIQADNTAIYLLLADLYQEQGQASRIPELIESASKLQSISKNSIVDKLSSYLP